MKRLFRTTIVLEVLSEDKPFTRPHKVRLLEDCVPSSCSGQIVSETSQEVSCDTMRELLRLQEGDPDFFGNIPGCSVVGCKSRHDLDSWKCSVEDCKYRNADQIWGVSDVRARD